MKRLSFILILALSTGLIFNSCALNPPPILTPTAALALTNGLNALSTILQAKGASPAILAAIADTQNEIALDIKGVTWGELVRQLMTDLYSQLPANIQNNTAVETSMLAIEVILATIGA